MRIFMTTDTVGGVWTFTEELASGLLEHGCAVCLVSIGDPLSQSRQTWCSQTQSEWPDRFRYERIDAPLEWMSNNQTAYTAAAPSLFRLAGDFQADVLHTSQFCFGALPLEIPKILTAHSDVLSWAQACRGGALAPSRWLDQYTALVTRGLFEADSIVAPTRWMADSLAANFSLPQPPIVIYNGRTLPRNESRSRKRQAITAGRLWDEAKNVSLLAGVNSPWPLLVAGETKHDGTATAPSVKNLTLLGAMASKELLTLFHESAGYICTSQYEPFGLAPLEAALCGCAVLAYDIPSLREVWGPAALYFDSPAALTSLLHALDCNPRMLAKAQQLAYARARIFSAKRMVGAYLQLFHRAAEAAQDTAHAA